MTVDSAVLSRLDVLRNQFDDLKAQSSYQSQQILEAIRRIEVLVGVTQEAARAASLNPKERLIVQTLGTHELKGEAIAKRAGVRFTSQFRQTLSSLCKQGVIAKGTRGYYVVDSGLS